MNSRNKNLVIRKITKLELERFVSERKKSAWISSVGAFLATVTITIAVFQLKGMQKEINNIKTGIETVGTVDSHVAAALEYYQSQNYKEAVKEYDLALNLDPNNWYIYNIRGFSLLMDGKAKESVASLEKSTQLNPKYSWGYYNLALAYWAAGEKEKIHGAVENAIKCDSKLKGLIGRTSQYASIRKSGLINDLLK